jgi:hypothetical protein
MQAFGSPLPACGEKIAVVGKAVAEDDEGGLTMTIDIMW